MSGQPGRVARVTLRDGRAMEFSSGDMQALISRSYSDFSTYQYVFIGGRCNEETPQLGQWNRPVDPACRDVNPGTFHLVLGDYLARRQQSFVADVSNDEQVWNQPVTGYRVDYANLRPFTGQDGSSSFRAPGTEQLVDVDAELFYTAEAEPAVSPQRPAGDSIRVSYQLELDRNGYIIGGEWTSKDRPDFLWQVRSTPDTRAGGVIDYAIVKGLLTQSLGNDPGPGPGPGPGPDPIGNVTLNVNDFRLINDGGLRPLVIASGTAAGAGAAYARLDAVTNLGLVQTLDRQPLQQGGQFQVKGRILEARVREFRLVVLDANLRILGQRSLGGG